MQLTVQARSLNYTKIFELMSTIDRCHPKLVLACLEVQHWIFPEHWHVVYTRQTDRQTHRQIDSQITDGQTD